MGNAASNPAVLDYYYFELDVETGSVVTTHSQSTITFLVSRSLSRAEALMCSWLIQSSILNLTSSPPQSTTLRDPVPYCR